jgi:DNA-binding CsgD family transcriptional regulator
MATRPDTTERRRAAAVLDIVEAARSPGEFLTLTLQALDEYAGIGRSTFVLALSDGTPPAVVTYAGTQHGLRPYVMEEYFERWSHLDALASRHARAAYAREGRATIAAVYGRLDAARRRYVDDFLRRTGDQYQVSFRLAGGGWSDGYVTLTGASAQDERCARIVGVLTPGLAERLRRHLPRGIEGKLSQREAQVAELLALGFTNRAAAQVMCIEEDTIKKHVAHAAAKLGLHGRTQLALCWSRGGLLELPVIAPGPSAP